MLTREELLKTRTTTVKLKALGGEVGLRKLSAGEVVGMDGENVGLMIARSLVDEDGNRLFSDDEADEAMGMEMQAVNELMEAIASFNGFDAEQQVGN